METILGHFLGGLPPGDPCGPPPRTIAFRKGASNFVILGHFLGPGPHGLDLGAFWGGRPPGDCCGLFLGTIAIWFRPEGYVKFCDLSLGGQSFLAGVRSFLGPLRACVQAEGAHYRGDYEAEASVSLACSFGKGVWACACFAWLVRAFSKAAGTCQKAIVEGAEASCLAWHRTACNCMFINLHQLLQAFRTILAQLFEHIKFEPVYETQKPCLHDHIAKISENLLQYRFTYYLLHASFDALWHFIFAAWAL